MGVLVVTGMLASYLIQKVLKSMSRAQNGTTDEDEAASAAAETRLHRLLRNQQKGGNDRNSTTAIPPLTSWEKLIAQDVIDPSEIQVEFADIGGLDDMKQEIWELAVLPLQRPELFASSHLLKAPGGILLYGPPGTELFGFSMTLCFWLVLIKHDHSPCRTPSSIYYH